MLVFCCVFIFFQASTFTLFTFVILRSHLTSDCNCLDLKNTMQADDKSIALSKDISNKRNDQGIGS